MSTTASHPLLDFAHRFGDPKLDYLNAHMALARLETLQEDLAKLRGLLENKDDEIIRFTPWFGAEIISYFAVAYVTCLEWHAKSRLVDLLEFNPSAITIEDVKGTIGDKLIVQMVAKQASVIQLVGASVRVSDLSRYLAIFGRVFTGLRLKFSPVEWLTGAATDSQVCWIKDSDLEYLQYLFDFRHQLVHELGPRTMGHPNIRDAWTPDEAERAGRLVTAVVSGIEEALTRYAPRMLPNLLTLEGHPISPAAQLGQELDYLSAEADEKVLNWEWNDTQTAARWTAAQQRFQAYRQAEEDFIERAAMLHWRYFDARTPLRERLLRYRIEFIEEVLSHFAIEETDNPNLQEQ